MNYIRDRLFAVNPYIKDHPLWPGSIEQQNFDFGLLTIGFVEDRLQAKDRCSDLTPLERSWVELWRSAYIRNVDDAGIALGLMVRI